MYSMYVSPHWNCRNWRCEMPLWNLHCHDCLAYQRVNRLDRCLDMWFVASLSWRKITVMKKTYTLQPRGDITRLLQTMCSPQDTSNYTVSMTAAIDNLHAHVSILCWLTVCGFNGRVSATSPPAYGCTSQLCPWWWWWQRYPARVAKGDCCFWKVPMAAKMHDRRLSFATGRWHWCLPHQMEKVRIARCMYSSLCITEVHLHQSVKLNIKSCESRYRQWCWHHRG